ncbi:MAG TPA: response regulator transcription factor [Chloroflexota bacterium]|nr:response regulator transcription factor [Chloroflexota bacterium]
MLKRERILVVEDDPQVAEILQWNLFAAGYPVTIVQDGLAALRVFDEERPALVTIDLNVPTVSGFRLLSLFKRAAPHVPVLVITASAFEEVEDVARDGADDFITKPFDPYQVVRKVEYHLRRTQTAQSPSPPRSVPAPRRAVPVEIA